MNQVRLIVNEHELPGSALYVLRQALLREVKRQAVRTRGRSRHTRTIARRELDAAVALARDAGCSAEAIEHQQTSRPRRRRRISTRRVAPGPSGG